MEINEKLREARLRLGLSQVQLAERLRMSQSHISDIEKGKVSPRLASVIDIARTLDQELILVPRNKLSMINAMLTGKVGLPLWQVDDDEDAEYEIVEKLNGFFRSTKVKDA